MAETDSDSSPQGTILFTTAELLQDIVGADIEFQFDLASASDTPVTHVPRGVVLNQCQQLTTTGYCSADGYIGEKALHLALSSYYGCDGCSENAMHRRPLVLMRTLIETDTTDPECAISNDYHHMALAPFTAAGDTPDVTEKHGIELVIWPRPSDLKSSSWKTGTVCRYMRGG